MERTCPAYQQLLDEYQRALQGWADGDRRNVRRRVDAELEGLEAIYQRLADHQQGCPVCGAELGYGNRSNKPK